jgi:hypothetical protein
MLINLYLYLSIALTFLSSVFSAPTPVLPGAAYYPWKSVQFTSAHSRIPADSTVEFTWKGGSGEGFEVYYIPQWVGQESYKVSFLTKLNLLGLWTECGIACGYRKDKWEECKLAYA